MLTEQEIVRALDTLLLGWSGILGHNTASMLKLDPETIDKLQGRAPGVSSQDATEVEGLVLSGAVFPKFSLSERTDIWGRLKEHNGLIWSLNSFFQDMWYLEACANCMKRLVVPSRDHPTIRSSFMRIYDPDHSSNEYPVQTTETTAPLRPCSQLARAELGYRQLWLYAQRHYPKIPRESEDENLTTRVNPEKADIILLCTMAQLALRLRFFSPRIQGLAGLSPDRQMARDVLLKARRPEYFQYKSDTFEDLVTQITQCFNQAVLVNHQTSLEPVASREPKPKSRCGLPLARDQKQDSRFLFLDTLHGELQHDGKVSTLFIRQCVDFTFFGKLPDEVYIPANVPPNLQGDSLLFVPQNDALPASTPELSRTEGLTEDLANDVAKDLARNRGKNPGRDRDKNRGKDRGKDRDGNQAKGRDTDRGQRGIEKGRPKRKLRRRAKASSDAETEYSSMSTDDAPKPQEPSQTEMEGVTQDAAGIHPPVNQSVTGQEYSHNVHQAQSEAAITEPNAMGLVEQSGLPQTQSNRDSIITTVDFEVLPEAPSHTGETQSNLEQRPDERQSSVVTEVPEDDVDDQLSDVLGVDGQHREIGNGHPTQKAPQPVDPARAKALAQLNNPRSPPHTHPAGESTRPRREVTRMHLSKVIENESERDQANIIHVNHSNRRAKDQHVRFDAPHAETDRTARAPEAGAQEVTPGQGARPVTRVDFASIPTVERSKPTPQSSRQDVGQVGRKVLKPRKTATNNSSPDQRLPEMVTVVFGIEGEDGEWQNRDEVTVHRSDPSAVEQKAKDFARAYQATFYTRESRNITPGQCFEAAMEDREHRIWMRWNNYETDDEL
ncbi:uncharacterized protein BDV17DRAFT_265629 [Aspergillus undulatus]|uniref:uncharacterized protein n=1 Tax=Aspergillus undulatus TaxID=1810928 RepID=UPI003CCC9A5B